MGIVRPRTSWKKSWVAECGELLLLLPLLHDLSTEQITVRLDHRVTVLVVNYVLAACKRYTYIKLMSTSP
jgi:hypothetical protein